MGYHRAGFTEIVGVDIKPQPRYPFTFVQADALEYAREHWREFDAIHASPPCQAFTQMSARWRGKGTKADEHIDWLTPTQAFLRSVDAPYVIENVPGATRAMPDAMTLHGGMFGLAVHRPRLFQSNVLLLTGRAPATKISGRSLRESRWSNDVSLSEQWQLQGQESDPCVEVDRRRASRDGH